MSKPCVAALLLLAAACGGTPDPTRWIGARAAVVRCGSGGRNPPAPVIAGVPAPLPPSGLLVRALDPVALDDLGFQRDTTVCAVLEAPTETVIEESARTLAELVEVQDDAAREALRVGGRCTCEVARGLELRELIPTCVDAATIAGCDPEARADAIAQALAPVLAAIDRTTLPWTHWRLVGATDRPGWLADHLDTLLAHHGGGSTAYVRGVALPTRVDPLVPVLLELEGVTVIVRQDAGRAFLIVRELDGQLVLDHFEQPAAATRRLALVDRVELAQVTAMAAALAPPDAARPLLLPPKDGTTVEIDVALLDDIDRAAIAASVLGRAAYVVDDERWEQPPRLFDRIAWQAPYGREGRVLVVEHALSLEGTAWAQTLADAPLIGNLGALGLADESPVFEPANDELELTLRGSTTARWGVHGVHRIPSLANTLEILAPGSLAGDLSHWRLEWPGAATPTDEPEVYAGLREQLSKRAYAIAASFDTARTRLTIEARPR